MEFVLHNYMRLYTFESMVFTLYSNFSYILKFLYYLRCPISTHYYPIYTPNWLVGRNAIVSGRFSVRISSGIPAILTVSFPDFFNPFMDVPEDCVDYSASASLPILIKHLLHTIWHCIVSIWKASLNKLQKINVFRLRLILSEKRGREWNFYQEGNEQ